MKIAFAIVPANLLMFAAAQSGGPPHANAADRNQPEPAAGEACGGRADSRHEQILILQLQRQSVLSYHQRRAGMLEDPVAS